MKKLPGQPLIPSLSNRILRPAVLSLILCVATVSAGASELRFGSPELRFSEGIGVVLVPLDRINPVVGEQVTIQTMDVSAVAGVDYVPVNEVYSFGADETEISILVKVYDNPQFQSDREFKLKLSNPVGLTLGAPSEVILTIADNDDPGAAGPGISGTNLYQGTFAIATNSLGRVILGGGFNTFGGEPMNNLARALPDGMLDPAFDPGTGPNDRVWSLAVDADDRVVIGGDFTMVDGTARNRIARLDDNGQVDTQFNPGTGANGLVESLEVMSDGRILMAGFFSKINGIDRSDVAILSEAGELDFGFNAVTPQPFIGHVARRAGNHVLVGGEVDFQGVEANGTNSLMRFDLTGARDYSFNVAVGDDFYSIVSGIVVQPDEKILICGLFTTVNGIPSSCIARLNPDGTYDDTFDVGAGANYWVYGLTLQADGRILVSGLFETIDGVPRLSIARLNADGTLDDTFDPKGGADNEVYASVRASNGRIMLAGTFVDVNGYDRFRFATLNSDGSLLTAPLNISSYSLQSGNELEMSFDVEPGRDFRVFSTEDFGVRTSFTTNTARHSFNVRQSIDGTKKFYYLEQGFPVD